MPLNPIPVGDSIAAFVKANAPAPGTPVSDSQLKMLWEGIMNIIYSDLQANMGVNPGSFVVAGVMPGGATVPVTGVGGPAE